MAVAACLVSKKLYLQEIPFLYLTQVFALKCTFDYADAISGGRGRGRDSGGRGGLLGKLRILWSFC